MTVGSWIDPGDNYSNVKWKLRPGASGRFSKSIGWRSLSNNRSSKCVTSVTGEDPGLGFFSSPFSPPVIVENGNSRQLGAYYLSLKSVHLPTRCYRYSMKE